MISVDIPLFVKLFLVLQLFYVIYKIHSIERRLDTSCRAEEDTSLCKGGVCELHDNDEEEVVEETDRRCDTLWGLELANPVPQGIFEEQEIQLHRENEFERKSLGELKKLADDMEIPYKKNCKKSALVELIQEKNLLSKDI